MKNRDRSVVSAAPALTQRGKIMLIGVDRNRVLERRFQALGYEVVCAANRWAALDIARHQLLDGIAILSHGLLLNVAEKVFNLKGLCPAVKIIVLLPFPEGARLTDYYGGSRQRGARTKPWRT